MLNCNEVLYKYWGYKSFRPLQDEIIKSVINGNDTLGLMPTGGGKSLTFQVPAMTMPGLCLVVSPLISLMKDQVNKLKSIGIDAVAIHSGCTREEIEIALNNCLFGGYKFLYVSPERIHTELFRIRYQEMQLNLIAVDEAHCISQWGYDFRPSYLKIPYLREIHPGVPILALTATATPPVIEDIQDKLHFRKKNVLKTSFLRENLIYAVRYSENKEGDLIEMVKKMNGTGIIYVRSRRKCVEICRTLLKSRISAAYYHAGVDHAKRNEIQNNWTTGSIRVIVATNAFGMGIDKHDVRFVIHADLPDSPESYFQEAGRAGRDKKRAFAILISSPADKTTMEQRIKINFPEIDLIKKVYASLGNFLQLPVGSGKGVAFDFHIQDFAREYRLNNFTAHSSLKILELGGYIELTEEINNPSRIKFILNRDDLYKFQVSNAKFDAFIKLLLRSYTGIFTEYTAIDEGLLAKRAGVDEDIVKQYLLKLSGLNVIRYLPKKRAPMVIFLEERLEEKSIYISRETYHNRRLRYIERSEAMLNYALEKETCRSRQLLAYFGEHDTAACGLCDVCRENKKRELQTDEFNFIRNEIRAVLSMESLNIKDLVKKIPAGKERIIEISRWMLDNNELLNKEGMLFLNK